MVVIRSTLWSSTVPASFLSLFSPRFRALVGPAQASETAQLPKLSNCSSQGPRACAGPEPLTSHHSSASTSLAYRWASSYHFDRADVQLLNFQLPSTTLLLINYCRSLKPLSILLSPQTYTALPLTLCKTACPSSCHAYRPFVHEVDQLVVSRTVARSIFRFRTSHPSPKTRDQLHRIAPIAGTLRTIWVSTSLKSIVTQICCPSPPALSRCWSSPALPHCQRTSATSELT